ncbi:T6SS immunity protein Tli4 family protein [Burkholderia anthina]|uniref:T6SS immunity protein Tli4 family protein n=1 Tax=Burkholderia anthina TaxID=179879 RepID=UPI0015889982
MLKDDSRMRLIFSLIIGILISSVACAAGENGMADLKTYCFGRYVADVPANAKFNGQRGEYIVGAIESDFDNLNQAEFERHVDEIVDTYKNGKAEDRFHLDRKDGVGKDGVVLSTSRVIYGSKVFAAYGYKLASGKMFHVSDDAMSEKRYLMTIESLKAGILPNLRARTNDEIPDQPGFCFKDGFIADSGNTDQNEATAISFVFPKSPGLMVMVQTMTTPPDEKSLLQRADSASIPARLAAAFSGVRTLRRGPREINGRAGEELLWSIPADGGYRVPQFRWESQGPGFEPLKPTVIVTLDWQGQDRPNMTDEQLIKLFDSITNSVRLRSLSASGAANVSDAGTPPVPLHSIVPTGAACPRSGWWTCPEANGLSVVGGSRQYFELGSVMPPVEVLNQPGILDRVLGRESTHSVPTTWTLVAVNDVAPPDSPDATDDNPKA